MHVQDKTIVITGGGSGMGRATVLELLERGARVAAIDISAEGLDETASLAGNHGNRLALFPLDITDRAGVEALPAQVQAALGPADGLINCAGIIQPFVRVNDLDYAAIERVMNVNFWGTVYFTKTFLPGLLERPEAHIANIASMGAFLPVPGQSIYGASKAAVKLMTEGLASELAETNVGVTIIFPGAVSTNIVDNSGVTNPTEGKPASDKPARQAYPAASAAKDIVNGIEKGAYRVLFDKDARFLDKLVRLAPKRAALFIAKQMKDLLS